jgi:UDP-N-acetylglucosamine 2-epimerase
MSDVFFDDLGIPSPDYHLGIGSGTHGAQTGAMLKAIEEVLLKERPDAVIVYGDTNSTLAGALAAAKLQTPIAHVEAGLRSFNRTMPEEINRILTDHISTWLFVPSQGSREQLQREGIASGIHVVGDIMYDALLAHRERADSRSRILETLQLTPRTYYVATIHRAENTDHADNLRSIFKALQILGKPVILPLHPRTNKRLKEYCIQPGSNLRCVEPLGYLDMIRLQEHAACILTDSGGVQKEAYYLGVPCVTLRMETEWVETVHTGWNQLCGSKMDAIENAVRHMEGFRSSRPNLYGDGRTADRIVDILTSDKK